MDALERSDFESNAGLLLLLDSLYSSVIYVDRWCVIKHANLQAIRWRNPEYLPGKHFIELIEAWENPYERQRELMQVMRLGQSLWQSTERSFENGREHWYRVDKVPTRSENGEINGALIIIDDITSSVIQEKALKESEARYRAFVNNSTDAIWRFDVRPAVSVDLPLEQQVELIYKRAELAECNDKLLELFDVRNADRLIGTSLCMNADMVKKRDVQAFIENDYRLERIAFEGINRKGERLLLETSTVGEVENGYLVRFWGTSRDVTQQKRYLDRMEHLANHDTLTGLPNRALLYRTMEETLAERADHQKCALLLIDLDRFKEINDTLGHMAGDKVLQELGPRLEAELEELPGLIARLGGDEFAIFLSNIRNTQQAVVMAHRFLDAICQDFDLDGIRSEISASIGVVTAPDQANDVTTLMRYADIAMYHAKTRFKGVSVYDSRFDSHSPVRLELMGALGRAIRENQLRLHFQPKVDLASRRIYGFEALLRWQHPELGFVPPCDFIPIAETSNVIFPLTSWVMEESVKQCAHWVNSGFNITVAMNLSARNLLDERIACELTLLLHKYGLNGEHLEMEITESTIMADPVRSQVALERISELGVKLSVDDFGTGYSSLAYLKRFPVSSLKIDGSFVQGMVFDDQDEIIVDSTIKLAHNLGLKVVAEGVEDQATYDRLKQLGCDSVQGYHVARPMSEDKAEEFLLSCAWEVARIARAVV